MRIKWDSVIELIILLLNLAYVIYIFAVMFSGKVRLGYMAIILFAVSIATIVVICEDLEEKFKEDK